MRTKKLVGLIAIAIVSLPLFAKEVNLSVLQKLICYLHKNQNSFY